MYTDILIVGGGPAGTAAAIACTNYGVGCLLVEAKPYPRHKLCGGLFTAKARHLLETLVGQEAARECLEACTMSRETEFSLWEGHQTQGLAQVVDVNPREPITLIDRVRFDEWMARHFEKLGDLRRCGRLIEGDALTSIDLDKHLATLASGRTIEYRRIIAADGANSFIEKCAIQQAPNGWVSRRAKHADAFCLETEVPKSQCPYITGVRIYFGVVPGSYAWAFSKGGTVCLGLVRMPGESFDVQATFREFLGHVGVHYPETQEIRGAMLPMCNPMKEPVAEMWRLLFAGDAAGLVEPLTGEGIYYAMQSGVFAAESHWLTSANNRLGHVGKYGRLRGVSSRDSLTRTYMERIEHLHRYMRKAYAYQRVLMHPFVKPIFLRLAMNHPRFIEYFYSTQIERASLYSFPHIVWRYLVGKA
jgi:flavin-dependent dehydrogenase